MDGLIHIDKTLFNDYDHDYDQHFDTSIRKRTHRGTHTHTCIHAYIKPRWLILLPKLYGDQQRALSLEYESIMVSTDSPNC